MAYTLNSFVFGFYFINTDNNCIYLAVWLISLIKNMQYSRGYLEIVKWRKRFNRSQVIVNIFNYS